MTQQMIELQEKSETFMEQARLLSEKARNAFRTIRKSPSRQRNRALQILAELLSDRVEREKIFEANGKDLANAREMGISQSMLERLQLDEKRMDGIVQAIREIEGFPDPVGEIIGGRRLLNGIEMIQKRVPLGVIFTVFESRPNVTIDVGALCLKAGNAAILRGGKEAIQTNMELHRLFQKAIREAGLPEDGILLVEETDRAYMLALLQQDKNIDLVVPRGGEALIQFVSKNSSIPVVKHDKGVCNMFVDVTARFEQSRDIILNAKLQRPSVCNSIENLIIDSHYDKIPQLLQGLAEGGIQLIGCDRTRSIYPAAQPIEDPDEEYSTEYLDQRLSVKIVDSLDEALAFIHRYSSGHSEAILSEDRGNIQEFLDSADSAALFVNCSTRFHDGGQMGMGAEVGISTQRLHVRGPMGVRDLTTTTYVMAGEGQIRE